jgi:hypothetical protein
MLLSEGRLTCLKKEKKQVFCFSVIGRPFTKKRARTGVGISKAGKSYRWAVTPDDWYENMIREAFMKVFPDSKPIGYSFCYPNKNPEEYYWEVRDGVLDRFLPKVVQDEHILF